MLEACLFCAIPLSPPPIWEIDGDFSPGEREAIGRGVAVWGPMLGLCLRRQRVRFVRGGASGHLLGEGQVAQGAVEIVIHGDKYLARTIAHELGHACGLHHKPGNSIMNAVLDDAPDAPTEQDMQDLEKRCSP